MKVDVDGRSVRLPDFLIVGAARSGTTSLYRYLRRHPDLYLPTDKEPHFLAFAGDPPRYGPDISQGVTWRVDAYLRLFEDAPPGTLTGEASTSYLYFHDEVIENIRALYGSDHADIKIIIVLRDPVQRAFSHHSYLVAQGVEDLPFRDAIDPALMADRSETRWDFDYVGFSRYYEQVEHYLDAFEHVGIWEFSLLKEDPSRLVREILEFLGVDPDVSLDLSLQANRSGTARFEWIRGVLQGHPRINRVLKDRFPELANTLIELRHRILGRVVEKPDLDPSAARWVSEAVGSDVRKLEGLLGREFDSWNSVPEDD